MIVDPQPARRSAPAVCRRTVVRFVALLLAVSAPAHAADPARGAQLYEARCGGCHAVDTDRVGPRHAGLAGRKAGSVTTFDFSPALRASNIIWNADTLERWLADPERLIPGQRMGYRLDDASERADVIAYLLTLR